MTWEQELMALQALSGPMDCTLFMRKPGDWGVHVRNLERKEGGCLSGGGLSGKTPEDAVHRAWDWATDQTFYMVRNAYSSDSRKAFRWNGFMWADVDEKQEVKP